MASDGLVVAAAKVNSGLTEVGTFSCDARCCCVSGDVIWVAELKGGIALYNTQTCELLCRVPIGVTAERVHVRCMVHVYREIWAGDSNGTIHIFDAPTRRWKRGLTIHGMETSAPITSLHFDGKSLLAASDTGRVVQWDPFSKAQVAVFVALDRVAVVTVAAGLVAAGDVKGTVYCWDPVSGEVVREHASDSSGVSSMLAEPTSGTLWVGRRNGMISVYGFTTKNEDSTLVVSGTSCRDYSLRFDGRLHVGDGAVTSMVPVSGKVMATSYNKSLVVFNVLTREVVARVPMAHGAFIHSAARVYCCETIRAWTLGNDGTVRVWDVAGYFVPAQSPPPLSPFQQAVLAESAKCILTVENSHLATREAAAQGRVLDLREELRRSRDELHEIRIRSGTCEETIRSRDLEIATRDKRVVELEEEVKKLHKNLTDSAARADIAQRESSMLRVDLARAQQLISESNALASTRVAERSSLEQQLSAKRVEGSQLEIRLRDSEAVATQLRAENARLHGMLSQLSSSQSMDADLYKKTLSSTEGAVRQELEELRRRAQLMNAMIISMEYTIRRKEEEDRDMTALLNAFRRKVADHVTDPHLAALLNLTMMRNPNRFDMECDEHTKSMMRDRNGPFIRFLQMLRDHDPNAYDQLVKYLQHPEAGSHLSTVFERLLALAQKENGASPEDLATFKKSLPALLEPLEASRVGHSALADLATKTTSTGAPLSQFDANRGIGASGVLKSIEDALPGASIVKATSLLDNAMAPSQQNAGVSNEMVDVKSAKTGEDQVHALLKSLGLKPGDYLDSTTSLLLGGGGGGEDSYIKHLRSAFEFILQTRRDLVEQLALLLKRTIKARQVVDALTSNARDGALTQRRSSGLMGGRQSLASVVTSILDEIHRLAADVVSMYLTGAEKQRHGVSI